MSAAVITRIAAQPLINVQVSQQLCCDTNRTGLAAVKGVIQTCTAAVLSSAHRSCGRAEGTVR
jgi:hypothetical protein